MGTGGVLEAPGMLNGQAWWKGRKWRTSLGLGLAFILALVGAVAFLLPFVWAISTSLKPDGAVMVFPPQFIPKPAVWANYPRALTALPFNLYFRNSIFITVMCLIGDVVVSVMAAYGFSRISFPGREPLFMILLGTMMLPPQVTMIPVFMLWRVLGATDTYYPLIVPSYFGSPFYIFLLRQFFMTIPFDLEDAARIDGASRAQVMWRIMIPLAGPAIATVCVMSFMAHWQEFFGPLIYLSSTEKFTVPLGLRLFRNEYGGDQWNLMMAATVVSLIPSLVLFFSAQRFFVSGIVMSGMKG